MGKQHITFYKPVQRNEVHRPPGLAQNFDISQVEATANTAAVIYEPEYPYLENTIGSMQVAYDYGADCVEFDIQLTKDGQLACFHDYTLEYRTDGTGEIADYTMAELKQLDIGYGYTADGGETYPFRGQGVGLMPSIEEVFETFPDEELLIHIRSYSVETGEVLWSYLSQMSEERLDKITIYGSKEPIEYLREQCLKLRVMNKDIMIDALIYVCRISFSKCNFSSYWSNFNQTEIIPRFNHINISIYTNRNLGLY